MKILLVARYEIIKRAKFLSEVFCFFLIRFIEIVVVFEIPNKRIKVVDDTAYSLLNGIFTIFVFHSHG